MLYVWEKHRLPRGSIVQQRLVVDRPGWDSETTWRLSWFLSTSLGRELPGWHSGERETSRSVFLPLLLPGGAEISLESPGPPGQLTDGLGTLYLCALHAESQEWDQAVPLHGCGSRG